MRLFALTVLLAVGTKQSPAQTSARAESGTVIEARGVGTMRLAPDHAVITMTVSARDSSAALAANRTGVTLRRLLDSLNAFRQPPESIAVVALSVRSADDRTRPLFTGYEAATDIRYTLQQLDRIGGILDVALRSGATGIRGVSYRSNREDVTRREVLAIAFANAKADALALASAANMELGPLLHLTTTTPWNVMSLAEESRWESVEITPRDIGVSASVVATFRLIPRR